MNVNSLLDLLSNFESAVEAAAKSGTLGAFTAFRQLFLGHEEESVVSFVNSLIKQRDVHGRGTNTPPIATLRRSLAKLEACLRSAEAKKAANDVAKIVELLEGCGQASIAALVSDARGWLVEASQPNPKSNRANRASKKLVKHDVKTLRPADYATLLKQATKENAKFDQMIEQLRADRNIKKPDMREVARLFLGYELAKKKGRKDALTEIIERQTVEARQDARGSLLDRLKSW